MHYVKQHKSVFGVEPICTALTSADVPIAASTFYAARTRPPSARAVRDQELKPIIARVHKENYGVYGIRKVHAALRREEVLAGSQPVARCTAVRTTIPATPGVSPTGGAPRLLRRQGRVGESARSMTRPTRPP